MCEVEPRQLRALKAASTHKPREKTFIVDERGVSQVLSGENREVRSGVEVSDKHIPPLPPLWTPALPLVAKGRHIRVKARRGGRQRWVGRSTAAGFHICDVRIVRKMYRTFFLCLSAKDIFQKNARGELWPSPSRLPPSSPPVGL